MALNETMLRPQGLQQWSHGQTPGSQAVSWHRHCYCFKSSSLGLLRSPQTQVSSRLLQNVKRAAIASVTEATSEYPLAPVFRYPGEHAFNLHEYLVTLDKPLGLVLAPDPITGQIVVQSIVEGSPAAECDMIQVGDVVKMCSAVFGEDMWQANDIRRIRWAINNRTSKVKLVLQRSRKSGGLPTWYSKGLVGRVCGERDALQLPVSFVTTSSDEWISEMAPAGKPLSVGFHRGVIPTGPSTTALPAARPRPALAAQAARLELLRQELEAARKESELDLTTAYSKGTSAAMNDVAPVLPYATSPLHRPSSTTSTTSSSPISSSEDGPASRNGTTNSNSSSNGGTSQPFGHIMESLGAGSSMQCHYQTGRTSRAKSRERKVTPVLPWLLVTSGPLDTRDLTHVASCRGLSSLLELGLSSRSGAMAVRGADGGTAGITLTDHQGAGSSSSSSSSSSSGGGSGGGLSGAGGACVGASNGRTQGGLAAGLSIIAGADTTTTTTSSSSSSNSSSNSSRGGGGVSSGSGGVGASTGAGAGLSVNMSQRGVTEEVKVRSLLHTTAALHRLAIRRVYGTMHHAPPEACAVLLHCEPGMEEEVAILVAGWMHWCCRMPLQEAILSAEVALGCSIDQTVLEAATEALVSWAEEKNNKVVLTWRYGGLSAYVAGDVVGSWSSRVPLLRCKNPMGCKGSTARGNFFLEITGLRPGLYTYKYIVDGTWAVDPTAPKVLDAGGNWNNVLEVHEVPPIVTSGERLLTARCQALHLALETKLGLKAS